ncbi:MAG: hypothetical protein Q8L27_00145 [archaeon]|nr:hypothetical protein [archaeon]
MVEKLDAKYIKEKLVKYILEKGPSLPVNLAKHVGLNSLFTSAFLSELSSEGMIKISNLKVGGSPLYFTADKVQLLENFTNHLGKVEREAYILLKEKGFLQDETQNPITRVALRGLKDFAIPFKKNEKIFWKYFSISDEEIRNKITQEKPSQILPEIKQPIPIQQPILEKIEEKPPINKTELEKVNLEIEEKRKELEKIKQEILEFPKTKKESKKIEKTEKKIKKINPKEEKFLNEIKELIEKKNIQLLNIEQYDKKQVFARVKIQEIEYLLAAYDKKKVEASDIMKAYKKALTFNIPYYILSKGETSKKTKEIIDAYKKLAIMESMEEKIE